MQNQEIKETKDRKTVQVGLQEACYRLPRREEAVDALYDRIETECKDSYLPYVSQQPQSRWWNKEVPKWYSCLLNSLTNDRAAEQKTRIEQNLIKHLWGRSLNELQKRRLQKDIQILTWLLNDKIEFHQLTINQKEFIKLRLFEGIMQCTEGFVSRVADVLSNILNPAKSVYALISRMRHQLVDKAMQIAEAKHSVHQERRGDVHTRNRFLRIASGVNPRDGINLGLGVKELYADVYGPQEEIFEGASGTQIIREVLTETFKIYFTPFHVFYNLQNNIRNRLTNEGYRGRLSGEDESYTNKEYENFLISLKEFFIGLSIPDSIEGNLYFIFDENYQIKDINWPFIRGQLWYMLTKTEPTYFRIIPAGSDVFDLLLQEQPKKTEESVSDSDDLLAMSEENNQSDMTKEVKKHTVAWQRKSSEVLPFPQKFDHSTDEVLTDEFVSVINLENLEEYIYFIASFELKSSMSKILLLNGIEKNIAEKASFPITEFLDLIFLTPPSSPLLNEPDTLEIIEFILAKSKNLFPVGAEQKIVELRNKMLFKMIEIGFIKTAKILISNGAEAATASNETLLILASKYGHLAMAEEFLKSSYNTRINESNKQGMTALHYAAQQKNEKLILCLLAAGADPTLKNKRHKTALDLIFDQNHSLSDDEIYNLVSSISPKYYDSLLAKMVEKGFVNATYLLILKDANFDFNQTIMNETPWTLALKSGNLHIALLCLERYKNQININQKNKDGKTPLHQAADTQNFALFKLLLEKGADIDLKDSNQQTAVDIAKKEGCIQIIHYVERLKDDLESNFYQTAAKGHIYKMEIILGIREQNKRSEEKIHNINRVYGCDRMTTLHAAAEAGHLNMVVLLCNEGADLGLKNTKGKTALDLAKANKHTHVAKYLQYFWDTKFPLLHQSISEYYKDIQDDKEREIHQALVTSSIQKLRMRGVNVTCEDEKGMTALAQAAIQPSTEMIQLLYDENVDVNYQNNTGMTALHAAVIAGRIDTIQFLLEKGADPFLRTVSGKSALTLAWDNSKTDVVRHIYKYLTKGDDLSKALYEAIELEDTQMIRLLANEDTVNLNQQTYPEQMTPLHIAALTGDLACAESLLNENVNFNLLNTNGKTALQVAEERGNHHVASMIREFIDQPILHRAAVKGDSKKIQSLIEKSTNVTNRNKHGQTALMEAAKMGHLEVVNILLTQYPNMVNSVDDAGNTACMIAIRHQRLDVVDRLLENADINHQNAKGETALIICAAEWVNIGLISKLLKKGARPNLWDKNRNTALHYAAKRNAIGIVQELLNNGANPNLKNSNNKDASQVSWANSSTDLVQRYISFPALFLAAQAGDSKIVQALINTPGYIDVRHKDTFDRTALFFAAQYGQIEVAKILIEKNNSIINMVDRAEATALTWAVYVKNFKMVKLLIENKANVNHKDRNDVTVLMNAADKGDFEITKYLLNKGAKINLQSRSGDTALFYAITSGNYHVVELLLENGADPYYRKMLYSGLQQTALQLAEESGSKYIAELIQSYMDKPALHRAAESGDSKKFKMLIDNEVNFTSLDKTGQSAMTIAAKQGCVSIFKFLLEKNKENFNAYKDFALRWGVYKGHFEMVQFLLESGVDINLQDIDGKNALHYAIGVGNIKYVKLLLEKGAILTLKSKDGKTPLDFAIECQSLALKGNYTTPVYKEIELLIRSYDLITPASEKSAVPEKRDAKGENLTSVTSVEGITESVQNFNGPCNFFGSASRISITVSPLDTSENSALPHKTT